MVGILAARMAGLPAEKLTLVGITGTNGKTTTTYLVESMLAAAGDSPGVVGTVSYRYGGRETPAPYTTPTPLLLHGVLAEMVDAGCSHAVLEVSSAALSMDRMAAVQVKVAAFTNLTQDHLDIHGTMDAYRDAKALLMARHLRADGVAVVNVDDPTAEHMAAAAGERRVIRVSARADADADVRVISADSTIAGITAVIQTPRGELELRSTSLLGAYNIANMAMATAIGEALALPHEAIRRGIAEMKGVPGRVERVTNRAGLDILVDYAHTPDALANALSALRPLTRRRLICVFGCGGDRDASKRPLMGAAVSRHADLPVVTSDNPRSEDPRSIIDMILPAVPAPFFVDPDRRTAICAAVAEAVPGDVVLIAGKGHEDYQVLGTRKVHFDDREEAAAAADARTRTPIDQANRLMEGRLLRQGSATHFTRAIIDGRIAAPGDLYFAIRGETHDGHAFCAQAVEAGAAAVVVDRDPGALEATTIEVDDTRVAIGKLARDARRRWGESVHNPGPGYTARERKRLIAVTGSAGKTTTKDLIAAALSGAGRVHRSQGSLNNETGVPLTIFGLRPFHDFAVVEMGMRAVGQIAYLAGIAEPDVGVVVNAGTAHVGVVGSVEAIARGKAEVFGCLPAHGCAVLPAGDPRLAEHARGAPRRITFGEEDSADVRLLSYRPAGAAGADLAIAIRGREHSLRLPLVGRHNAINAACALAASLAVEVPVEVALAGLAAASPAAMRSELREIGGRHVLVDCYNANPASMSAALTTLAELRGGGRAVAVVGDMLELGDEAPAAHRAAGHLAAELGIEVVALGEHRAEVVAGAAEVSGAALDTNEPAAAAEQVISRTRPGDWILVKASRGMRLERVVEELVKATDETTRGGE